MTRIRRGLRADRGTIRVVIEDPELALINNAAEYALDHLAIDQRVLLHVPTPRTLQGVRVTI